MNGNWGFFLESPPTPRRGQQQWPSLRYRLLYYANLLIRVKSCFFSLLENLEGKGESFR